jgi:hypothetical protein
MVAIQGPSGSGKSTLLYLLGCMLPADRGQIRVLGQDVTRLSDQEKAFFRNRRLGFVFQQFHLLPSRNILQNILLPISYPLEAPSVETDYSARAKQIAERIGLGDRLNHRPQQLSGGQQQRVGDDSNGHQGQSAQRYVWRGPNNPSLHSAPPRDRKSATKCFAKYFAKAANEIAETQSPSDDCGKRPFPDHLSV